MIKKILFTIIALMFIAKPAMAVDLTVDCNSSSCITTPSGEVALFGESEDLNWDVKPGDTIRRKIRINNNQNDSCSIYLKTAKTGGAKPNGEEDGSLDEVLQTVIARELNPYFGLFDDNGNASNNKFLRDLFGAGLISLGTIPANTSGWVFDWVVTIDPSVGNEFQRASTRFDFDMTFECGNPTSPTPTPTSTSTPNNGGGIGGAFVCADPAPTQSPNLTVVLGAVPGTVELSWNAIAGATNYMVQYGTEPGKYLYGNNNIGNTTSYTVTSLGTGSYYFQVTALNGCAPGPWSNEGSSGTVAGTATGPAEGFEPILGVTTDDNESGEVKGEVDGVQDSCCPRVEPLWWIVLILQTLILVRYFMQRIKAIDKGQWLLMTLAVSVLAIVIHWLGHPWFIGRGYMDSPYCNWHWLMAIINGGVLAAVFRYVFKEEHEK